MNHRYEPQSKLWKQFRRELRDCSTYKFQFTSLLKFESHNKLLFHGFYGRHDKLFKCFCLLWDGCNFWK